MIHRCTLLRPQPLLMACHCLQYFEDHCMLEQRFVVDDSIRVKEALAAAGQRLGGSVSITALARMQCGEGLEHPEQASFSEQVADTVQQAAQTG